MATPETGERHALCKNRKTNLPCPHHFIHIINKTLCSFLIGYRMEICFSQKDPVRKNLRKGSKTFRKASPGGKDARSPGFSSTELPPCRIWKRNKCQRNSKRNIKTAIHVSHLNYMLVVGILLAYIFCTPLETNPGETT